MFIIWVYVYNDNIQLRRILGIGMHPFLSYFRLVLILLPLLVSACGGGDNSDGSENISTIYYQDSDNDGYGDPANSLTATLQPTGYVLKNTDCNDGVAAINPGATELTDDGIDNNCDGLEAKTYYLDSDGDGYGDPANSVVTTSPPFGYALNNTDCNDGVAAINPGAAEIPDDGIDNNCDGLEAKTYFLDSDGDGYGDPTKTIITSLPPTNYVLNNKDCDDGSAAINPITPEFPADSTDNNCNGQVDEVSPPFNMNDTGIMWTGKYPTGNNTSCTGDAYKLQDCSHGRDVTHNDSSDGHAGFSYTKLDSAGNDLEAIATNWSCVRDNVTGLIWEVRQGGNDVIGDEGLHDADDRFSWYFSDPSISGNANDYGNHGDYCYGYDIDDVSSYCNTEAYIDRVNNEGYCGASNWRLPNSLELLELVDGSRTNPSIDTNYFPDITNAVVTYAFPSFWSSSPLAFGNYVRNVSFFLGTSERDEPIFMFRVRLVHDGP